MCSSDPTRVEIRVAIVHRQREALQDVPHVVFRDHFIDAAGIAAEKVVESHLLRVVLHPLQVFADDVYFLLCKGLL